MSEPIFVVRRVRDSVLQQVAMLVGTIHTIKTYLVSGLQNQRHDSSVTVHNKVLSFFFTGNSFFNTSPSIISSVVSNSIWYR